jgi:hypothetical protein
MPSWFLKLVRGSMDECILDRTHNTHMMDIFSTRLNLDDLTCGQVYIFDNWMTYTYYLIYSD